MRPVEPVDIEREKRYLEILAIVLFIVSSIWVLWKAFRRPASLENSRPKEQKVLIGHKLFIHAIMTPGKLIIFGFQTRPSPQGWIIGISSTGDMEQVPILPVNSLWKNQPLAILSNGYIIAPVKRDYGKVLEIICIDQSGYRLLWKRPLPSFDWKKVYIICVSCPLMSTGFSFVPKTVSTSSTLARAKTSSLSNTPSFPKRRTNPFGLRDH